MHNYVKHNHNACKHISPVDLAMINGSLSPRYSASSGCVCRVAEAIFSKQSRTADEGCFPSVGVGRGTSNFWQLKRNILRNAIQGLEPGQILQNDVRNGKWSWGLACGSWGARMGHGHWGQSPWNLQSRQLDSVGAQEDGWDKKKHCMSKSLWKSKWKPIRNRIFCTPENYTS
jgi:hypothetical protein